MLSSSIYHAKFSLASIYNYRRGFLLRRQRPGAFNLDGTAREQETRANTRKINLRAGGRAGGRFGMKKTERYAATGAGRWKNPPYCIRPSKLPITIVEGSGGIAAGQNKADRIYFLSASIRTVADYRLPKRRIKRPGGFTSQNVSRPKIPRNFVVSSILTRD